MNAPQETIEVSDPRALLAAAAIGRARAAEPRHDTIPVPLRAPAEPEIVFTAYHLCTCGEGLARPHPYLPWVCITVLDGGSAHGHVSLDAELAPAETKAVTTRRRAP